MSIQNPKSEIRIDGEGERQMKVDRLSSLPDHILHNVLSFLDSTKLSAQTSVLSGRWRSLWKHVPRLTFNTESFSPSSFARYVDEVLSRRPEGCSVESINYLQLKFSPDKQLLERVVNFAASHGCQELCISVPYDDDDEGLDSCLFVPLANSNLRTLLLRDATLGTGFGSCGFGMLTVLNLDWCWLSCNSAADRDPFANFPCLENLVLRGCVLENEQFWFKISGPRLVKLKISRLDCSELEVFAPNLKFLDLRDELASPRRYQLHLPSLDHADIRVSDYGLGWANKEATRACAISLLQGLHNASSLLIDYDLFELLPESCEFWEHQPCPFTRLRSLKVDCCSLHRLPYHVISYFLKNSSSRHPAYIEFVQDV